MAIKNSNKGITASADFKKADGFLNLTLVDSNGKEFRLGKGLPLHLENALQKAMLSAPAGTVFKLTATVQVVDDSPELPVFA